jgi:hypothetical protein
MLDVLGEDDNARLSVTDAISLWAPWAWAVCFARKDVENRPGAPIAGHARKFIGKRLAIHCSLWGKEPYDMWMEFDAVRDIYRRAGVERDSLPKTTLRSLDALRGHIVGHVRVDAVVTEHDSPWFFGPYGILISNPVVFSQPIKCRGAQGIWRIPSEVARQLAEVA